MKNKAAWLALALSALAFVVLHLHWMGGLPEKLATHFDGAGNANGWMTRKEHATFMLLFGLGVPGFIVILVWAMRYFNPALVNVPNPDYWRKPEHFPEACDRMFRWAIWQAAGTLIWMTFLNKLIVDANLLPKPHLSGSGIGWLTSVFIAFTAGSIIWVLHRFKKPTAAA